MEFPVSPLQVETQFISTFEFRLVQPKGKSRVADSIEQIAKRWPIDVDFGTHDLDDSASFVVHCKIAINKGKKPFAGYSIYAESATVFRIDESQNIEPDVVYNLKTYSAVAIALQHLRAAVMDFTSRNGIEGIYRLPTVNVVQLITKKIELQESEETES